MRRASPSDRAGSPGGRLEGEHPQHHPSRLQPRRDGRSDPEGQLTGRAGISTLFCREVPPVAVAPEITLLAVEETAKLLRLSEDSVYRRAEATQ